MIGTVQVISETLIRFPSVWLLICVAVWLVYHPVHVSAAVETELRAVVQQGVGRWFDHYEVGCA